MPDDVTCCPTQDDLRRFLLGQIEEADAARLAGHLSGCSPCLEALAGLESRDTLLAAMQAQAARTFDSERALVEGLIDRLSGRPRAGDAAAPLPETDDAGALPSTADAKSDTAVSAPSAAAPGERRGSFAIIKPHAQGGLGQVSIAHDEKLRRQVALKEIRADRAADPYLRQRFVTEAEITGQLEHPGIVPVYTLDEDASGRPYYAMRFIQGRTLAEAIRDYHAHPAPLVFRELLKRFVTICQTIAYAHSKSVIHRDLKPANVMLGEYGETLVVDWGLAKQLASAASPGRSAAPRGMALDASLVSTCGSELGLTTAGQVLGTPGYMSPEQAAGHSQEIGPATDVYALGAILYEILAGRKPYADAGNVAEILRRVATGVPPHPPSQLAGGIPAALEAVCRKAMAHSAADRYAAPQELAGDIDKWLADEPVSCYEDPFSARLARWARRHRSWVQAAVSALWLIAVVATLSALLVYQEKQEKAFLADVAMDKAREARAEAIRAEQKSQEARAASHVAQQQRDRAEWQLYVSQIAAALHEWEAGDARAAWDHLNDCREDLRGWEHDYLFTLFNKDQRTLTGHKGGVTGVAYSPDGARLASCGLDGTLRVWEPARGEESLKLTHASPASCLAFAPDGRHLVSAHRDATLTLWDTTDRKAVRTFQGHSDLITCVAFSPDGQRIASGSHDRTLKVWDIDQVEALCTLQDEHRVTALAYGPDGDWIVSCTDRQYVRLWDLESRKEITALPGHPSSALCVAVSRDGNRLATGAWDRMLRLWDVPAEGENPAPDALLKLPRRFTKFFAPVKMVLQGHADRINSVVFSRDGRQLASGSADKTVKLWNPARSEPTRSFKGHTDQVLQVAFSPDGTQIASASADETIKLWHTSFRRDTRTLASHTTGVTCAAISPDGKRIVSGSSTPAPKLWDAVAGKEQVDNLLGWLVLRQHSQRIAGVAFSPDGKRFATASWDKTLKVWDAVTLGVVHVLEGHDDQVLAVAFSPDGKQIASGSRDATVKLWDAETGMELSTLRGHAAAVSSVAFRPDSALLVSAGHDRVLKLWDVATRRNLHTFEGHTDAVESVAFHPGGKQFVSGSKDLTLRLWDAETGESRTLSGHTGDVTSVAFSPDGKRIASGSQDLTLKLWDPTTGSGTLTLTGHEATVMCVAFSPDGKWILSGSEDKTLRIWDASRQAVAE
jgi:WD40 repeat protein/serine/threonine protein kinase